jgi:hypothetical protein
VTAGARTSANARPRCFSFMIGLLRVKHEIAN